MSPTAPPPFPATKFHPPRLGAKTLVRSGLLDLSRIYGFPRACLFDAPAGFGKSIALRQWLAHAQVGFSWLSLDEDDSQSWDFWRAVTQALTMTLPGLRADEPDVGGEGDLRRDVLLPLIDALTTLEAPHVLVLDDLQLIDSEQTLATLDWWIARLPPELCVAVTTRSTPELPALEDLSAHGALFAVDAADLRFSGEEVATLLVDRLGLELDAAQLARIAAVTEGWPAAVSLTAAPLARGLALEDIVVGAARDRDPLAALMRQALMARSPHDRDVLLGISVLERFNAALVTELIGSPSAWDAVQRISDRTEFLIGLDDGGEWYRLHHLVREVLEAELRSTDPERRRALHARAAAIFERADDLHAGMHHLLAAEDWEGASEYLNGVFRLMAVPRHAITSRWLRQIPVEVRRSDPRLCFVGAWQASMLGDREARDFALATGRRIAGPGPVGDCSSWESAEQVVLAACAFDDVAAALRAAERALELEAPDSNPAAMTRWKRGALLYLAGRTAEAREVLEAELGSDFDPPKGPLIVLPPAYLALTRLQEGDADGARGMVQRAVDARTRTEFRQEVHSLVALEALARLRTEQGDPEAGLRAATDAVRQCADGAVDTMLVVPRLLGEVARAQLALGDTDAAAVALRQAREMIAGARDPGMLPRRFDRLAAAMPAASADAEAPQTAADALSQRELEVLTMLPGPLSAAQIATELFVSANTVRTHIKSIHRKLGVSSRSDAVQRARRRGLLAAS